MSVVVSGHFSSLGDHGTKENVPDNRNHTGKEDSEGFGNGLEGDPLRQGPQCVLRLNGRTNRLQSIARHERRQLWNYSSFQNRKTRNQECE